jgi:general secretion pathway protein B
VPPAASTARIAPNAATGVPPIAPQPATPLDDIGAAQRAGLPPLQITGHTYSDNPTLRMLMIDGHMVVEGQALAPGLRLERIGPHQAIFNHRGTRFSVGY